VVAPEISVGRTKVFSNGTLPNAVDLDIKGFFDNIDHELMNRAVRKHAKEKWTVLYIEGGQLIQRDKGTPQGAVVSPLPGSVSALRF